MTDSERAVLILIDGDFEDMEVMYPKYRLREAGYAPVVAGLEARHRYLGKNGYPCVSDAAIAEMEEPNFAGIVLPGGWAPDKLRRHAKVKSLVSAFDKADKLGAAICHGGSMAISAGVYDGVYVTGSPGIKDDLINAGGLYEDKPVVIDGHFVSSRNPDDLPEFMRGVLAILGKNNVK